MNYIRAKEGPPNYGEKEWTVQYFDDREHSNQKRGNSRLAK